MAHLVDWLLAAIACASWTTSRPAARPFAAGSQPSRRLDRQPGGVEEAMQGVAGRSHLAAAASLARSVEHRCGTKLTGASLTRRLLQ